MSQIWALIEPSIEAMIFGVVMKVVTKLNSDPNFAKRAEVVHAQKTAAKTVEEHQNAAQAIHDLLHS